MKKYNYLLCVVVIALVVCLIDSKSIVFAAEAEAITIQTGDSIEEEILLTANYTLTYNFTDSSVASLSQVGSSIVYTNGGAYYGKKLSIHGNKVGTTVLTIYASGIAIRTYNIIVSPISFVYNVHEGDYETITYTSVYDESFITDNSDVSFSTSQHINSSTISINGNSITTITYTYNFIIGFDKEMDDSFIISGSTSGDIINISAKVSKHEWSGEYTIEKEETCTEDGYKDIRCLICNRVKADSIITIEHTGHDWNKEYTIDKKADCTNDGYKTIHCKKCNSVQEKSKTVIPALGHDWNKEYTIEKKPNCLEDGYKSIHCKICDSIKDNMKIRIPALGHDWDEGIVIKQPELDSKGVKECSCKNCIQKIRFSIPALTPKVGIKKYDTKTKITYEISSIGDKNEVSVYDCGKVSNVVIPDNIQINGDDYAVTSIDEEAFVDNYDIKKVIISNSVLRINCNAFNNCQNLKKVVIGKKIKIIDEDAFRDCKKLNSITVNSKSLTKIGKGAFEGINKKAKFKVPKKKLKKYKKMIKKAGAPKKTKITK